MKIFKFLLLTFVILNIAIFKSAIPSSAQQSSVSFQVFYNHLSPFGQWVDDPDYGFIWIPDAEPDFFPYATRGHWVFTEYGWTWVSDYAWGWAPFHYGRWDFNILYGWYWIPDEIWGPAWVLWRSGNGFYGWAPMPPYGARDYFDRRYRVPPDYWMFVNARYFTRYDLPRYYVRKRDRLTIIINTVLIDNTYWDKRRKATYMTGPRREDVQRATGTRIRQYSIYDSDRPGQNLGDDRLRIYRPDVKRYITGERRPGPSRVYKPDDFREPSNRYERMERRERPEMRQTYPSETQERRQQPRSAPSPPKERIEQPSTTPKTEIQKRQQTPSTDPPSRKERKERPATKQITPPETQRKQPSTQDKEDEQQRKGRRK